MFKMRKFVFVFVAVSLLLTVCVVAQTGKPGNAPAGGAKPATTGSSQPGQDKDGKSESKVLTLGNTKRAKEIFERTKILTAHVILASKGAKGVGAPITDRAAWTEIAKAPAFNVIPEAERLLTETIPEPDTEEYMSFYKEEKTDWRKAEEISNSYNDKFTRRRNRLFKLVLAECIENKGRFLAGIEEIILVLCSEPTWTIPWDDGEGKICTGASKRIDHYISQTAWNLATADYWLGKKLSPGIRDLIREKIDERIFSVFEEALITDDYGMIPWANDANLWNAYCHAAIIGTAQAMIDSPERRANYMAAAEMNVEKFLQIFSKDGYFPDGIWAWNQGYGSFIMLAEMFYQSTGGRIDLFKRPNIKETALYGPRMEVTPEVFVSFGDRWAGDRPDLAPTAFVSKRFQMGLTQIENRGPFFGVGPTDLFRVGIYCFPNSATQQKGEVGKTMAPPLETLRDDFPPNGVTIFRTGKKENNQIGVQLKAGSNEERGNHNDVGTFAIGLGGGSPITDIGSRSFRRGLVVKDHMDSNTYNSFGHSVPKIDGMLQKNGKGTVGSRLENQYTDDVDTLKIDLQYVYDWAEPKDLKELTRTFIYDRTGKGTSTPGQASLTVIDRLQNKKPLSFETCLMTIGPFKKLTEDPEATSIELIVGEGDQAVLVTVTNEVTERSETTNKFVKHARPLEFEAGALDETMPRTNNKLPIRLAFAFDRPVDDATMTVTIRPAPKNKRDLAKNDPDETTRTYTSPIDDMALTASATPTTGTMGTTSRASVDGKDTTDKYAALINEIKQKAPVPLETLLRLSDEELKVQIERFKRLNPNLRSLTEKDIDAIIRRLRGKPDQDDDESKSNGDKDPTNKYAALINEIKQKSPVPLETLLQLSDEELKAQIERLKPLNPNLRNFTEKDIDEFIKVLRSTAK